MYISLIFILFKKAENLLPVRIIRGKYIFKLVPTISYSEIKYYLILLPKHSIIKANNKLDIAAEGKNYQNTLYLVILVIDFIILGCSIGFFFVSNII